MQAGNGQRKRKEKETDTGPQPKVKKEKDSWPSVNVNVPAVDTVLDSCFNFFFRGIHTCTLTKEKSLLSGVHKRVEGKLTEKDP